MVATGGVAIGTFQSLTSNTDTVLEVKSRQPWAVRLLGDLVPDDGVEDEEQLVHGRDEGHLPGLAPPPQAGVEVTDGKVVATQRQQRPVAVAGWTGGSAAHAQPSVRGPQVGPRGDYSPPGDGGAPGAGRPLSRLRDPHAGSLSRGDVWARAVRSVAGTARGRCRRPWLCRWRPACGWRGPHSGCT